MVPGNPRDSQEYGKCLRDQTAPMVTSGADKPHPEQGQIRKKEEPVPLLLPGRPLELVGNNQPR